MGKATNPLEIERFFKEFGFKTYFSKFPGGYSTPLGEEGINISRGQSQLMTFARILYKKPLVLILDEFTSGMDMKMEEFVINLIQSLI